MSLLRVSRTSSLIKKTFSNVIFNYRAASYWNKDWKPGAYPLTKEERIAAAKKYGMIPEDYQPFEDDGTAPGDYPLLEEINESNRDPWEFYDLYPERRNYGEPLCWHQETLKGGWYDPHVRDVTYAGRSLTYMTFWCFAPFLFYMFCSYIGEQYKYFRPMMRRQYPYTGEAHYLFEKDEKH